MFVRRSLALKNYGVGLNWGGAGKTCKSWYIIFFCIFDPLSSSINKESAPKIAKALAA